jgi:hypothetical protein
MILIVVILLVAFIIVPLIELTLKEQVQFFAKLLVYVLALVYILYALITAKALV